MFRQLSDELNVARGQIAQLSAAQETCREQAEKRVIGREGARIVSPEAATGGAPKKQGESGV